MSNIKNSHAISGVFVFLLLGIFAVFSTIMVLLGTKAYRAAVSRSEEHNTRRIASSYIRSMLRADDEENALSVEEIDGIQAITMLNVYEDESYVTRIYVYDGMLREWFTEADAEFQPEFGETVCPADSMEAEMDGKTLTVRIQADGTETEIFFAPRTGGK